jgi:hypothetical protein
MRNFAQLLKNMSQHPDNRVHEPFWLLLTAAFVLTAFSLTSTGFSAGGFEAKPVHFLSDLETTGTVAISPGAKPLLLGQSKKARNRFLSADKPKGQIQEFSKSAITSYDTDTLGGLIHFFRALQDLKEHKRDKVRIAYFGDSMIEGDLITQDLRKCLQDTFGGYGVGFMPVTSITAGFRISISHSFSKNWQDYDLSEKEHRAGLCGHTFVPVWTGGEIDTAAEAGNSWVRYTASKNSPRLSSFYNVRMFYGPANGQQYANVNGRTIPLEGKNAVNQLTLNSGTPVNSIQVSFSSSEALEVYGFSIDSDTGIFVDNFSLRGNSGLPLSQIPLNHLSSIDQYLGYDLVIIHYGMNVVSSKVKNYEWYEKGMTPVIRNFQQSFPGTSILVVGSGDKGYKKDGRWTTDPGVPFLLQAQRNMAEKTGSAFWSLYDAMGGFESMATKWAGGDTLYANKDFCHFNFRGARKVGNLLFNELMRDYKLYRAGEAEE